VLRPALEPASRAVGAYSDRRYRVLFITLLLTLAIYPLGDALGVEAWLLGAFVALNLVVAAAGISDRPVARIGLVAASLVAVILRNIPEETMPLWLVTGGGLLWLAIAVTAAAGAVRFALRSTQVDTEHVAAALSAYLLAGLLFAVLYVLVDYRWPGSIIDAAGGPLTLDTAVYYSFVTLATLGYGDVVPRGVARGLAIVEAVGAQLYLTVTVARLVGLYALRLTQPPPSEPGERP